MQIYRLVRPSLNTFVKCPRGQTKTIFLQLSAWKRLRFNIFLSLYMLGSRGLASFLSCSISHQIFFCFGQIESLSSRSLVIFYFWKLKEHLFRSMKLFGALLSCSRLFGRVRRFRAWYSKILSGICWSWCNHSNVNDFVAGMTHVGLGWSLKNRFYCRDIWHSFEVEEYYCSVVHSQILKGALIYSI